MSTPSAPPTTPIPTPVPRPPDPAREPGRALAHPTPDPPAPPGGARVGAIDAARGVALLGMMAVHSLIVADAGGPTAVWELAGGRAAALFAVLAGVGIAFTTRRRRVALVDAPSVAAGLLARAAVIGVLGLALGFVDTDVAMVILPYYAVLFVVAIPLVVLPTALVALLGVAGAIALPFVSSDLRATMPVAELGNPGLADLVTDPTGLLRELLLTGLYPAVTWIAYVAMGIALGRLPLAKRRVAAALTVTGTALAVLATSVSSLVMTLGGARVRLQADAAAQGMDPARFQELLTSGGDGVTPATTYWWLALGTRHTGTPFDLLHTIGTSLAVIGVLLLLGHLASPLLRPLVALVQAPLAAAGSMTLTVYTLHLLFLTSNLDVYTPVTGYVLQVVVVLLGSMAWRATAGRGPLERLVSGAATRVARPLAPARREDTALYGSSNPWVDSASHGPPR